VTGHRLTTHLETALTRKYKKGLGAAFVGVMGDFRTRNDADPAYLEFRTGLAALYRARKDTCESAVWLPGLCTNVDLMQLGHDLIPFSTRSRGLMGRCDG